MSNAESQGDVKQTSHKNAGQGGGFVTSSKEADKFRLSPAWLGGNFQEQVRSVVKKYRTQQGKCQHYDVYRLEN